MGANVASFPALVLAGHGTRDAAGQAAAAELVAAVQRSVPGIRVEAAYVDHQRPGVATALRGLAADGVGRVAVVPLLLTAAIHSKTDIAAAVHAARRELPRMAIAYGRPLGPHPALLAAVADRLTSAGADLEDPGTAVVLGAAGAADPDANAEIAKTARLLWEGRGCYAVEPAFASATRPRVGQVVERLRRLGVERVAVAPYFLAPGYLATRLAGEARAAGADVVADVVGAHPELARLVVERYREAIGSDVRMNCDTCLYRVAVGGRADAVGTPLAARREAVG